jgi:two-component system sensor histidine kinase YesM
MRIRYADSFEETFEVEENTLSCPVPRFTLQPIVENAIVHGFANKDEPGHLLISVKAEGEVLHLSVWDDGQGMDEETIQSVLGEQPQRDENRYGIGIGNVRRRIALHYGAAFGISFESVVGEYTRATITLPLPKKEASE